MNRQEKLTKLGNAIRAYRGVMSSKTGKWKVPPNPGAVGRVRKGAIRLGLDPDEVVRIADSFDRLSDLTEFMAWVVEALDSQTASPAD